MNYVLLIANAPDAWDDTATRPPDGTDDGVISDWGVYTRALEAAGVLVAGACPARRLRRDHGSDASRGAAAHRRTLRRHRGAPDRLLRHRRTRPGCRPGLGRADAQRPHWCDRGAARGARLRR